MFSQMLVDQLMTSDMKRKYIYIDNTYNLNIVVGGRMPKMDDDTIEILSEQALVVYINYLDQLK